MIDKVEKKFAIWRGSSVSRAGRLILINSFISAIPSYLMSLHLPEWVVHKLTSLGELFSRLVLLLFVALRM